MWLHVSVESESCAFLVMLWNKNLLPNFLYVYKEFKQGAWNKLYLRHVYLKGSSLLGQMKLCGYLSFLANVFKYGKRENLIDYGKFFLYKYMYV